MKNMNLSLIYTQYLIIESSSYHHLLLQAYVCMSSSLCAHCHNTHTSQLTYNSYVRIICSFVPHILQLQYYLLKVGTISNTQKKIPEAILRVLKTFHKEIGARLTLNLISPRSLLLTDQYSSTILPVPWGSGTLSGFSPYMSAKDRVRRGWWIKRSMRRNDKC